MWVVVLVLFAAACWVALWLLFMHLRSANLDRTRGMTAAAALVCAVTAIITGVIGWWDPPGALGTENIARTLVTAAYRSAQHILLNANAAPEDCGILHVSRVFALATITLVAIEAISRLFADPFQRARLWCMRGHVVICGLGSTGSQLVVDAAKRSKADGGRKGIVVIDRDPDRGLLALCASHGAIFLAGDATDERVLEKASAHRAQRVFFVTGSDEANTEGAYRLRTLVEARGTPRTWGHLDSDWKPPKAHVHVRRVGLSSMFDTPSKSAVEIRGFSVVEEAALRVVTGLVTQLRPTSRSQTLHAVIVGFSPMARALALKLAEFGHFENCLRLRMTIVHAPADAGEVSRFSAQHPALFAPKHFGPRDPWRPDPRLDHWDFNTFVKRPHNATDADRGVEFVVNGGFAEMIGQPRSREFVDELVRLTCDKTAIPLVFLCCDADEDNCTDGKYLLDELSHRFDKGASQPVHIFAHVARRDAMAAFATHSNRTPGPVQLHTFGLSRETCTFEVLTSTRHVEIAAEVLESFQSLQKAAQAKKKDPKAALIALQNEPNWSRWSCMAAAMHVHAKLATLGLRFPEAGEAGVARAGKKAAPIVMEMEHNRWMAERLLLGWRFGKRDSQTKHRLQLVAWQDLSDDERKKDQRQVEDVIEYCLSKNVVEDQILVRSGGFELAARSTQAGLRVGWTGHRSLRDPNRVQAQIERALADLADEARAQDRWVTTIGGLADGADMLFAKVASRLYMPAHLILLREIDTYKNEAAALVAGAAHISTVPTQLGDPARHVALAEFMLERIDVLVAVWDGGLERDPGGTGDIVDRAQRAGKRVIVLDA